MIRKLRIRFTLAAIISVLLVLIALVGGINLLNYRNVVTESDELLKILSDNGGVFPERPMPEEGLPPDFRRDRRNDSPELPFETRYFTVEFDSEGNIINTDTGRIFAVSEQAAKEYATKIYSSGLTKGFVGDYRYSSIATREGGRLVIFCDCGISLSNFRSFLIVSLIISAICLVVVSIGVFLISGKAVKPVAESYEKQKRFITDAGHEIKTPLAIINADADVLLTDLDDDNEWVTDIKKQTSRLSELTNELIHLSKLEEGGITLSNETVDLSAILKDQAESFRAVVLSGNKTYDLDIENNLKVSGDSKSFKELFSILLDNAVKYCPEGKAIKVRAKRDGKNALIEISNDTKEDLDSETLNLLFDRFYRADSSRNSETGGHGIGLSIARAITEANKGKITAEKPAPNKISFRCIFKAVKTSSAD